MNQSHRHYITFHLYFLCFYWPLYPFLTPTQQFLQQQKQFFEIPMPKHTQSQIRRRIEASGEATTIDQLCLDGIPIRSFSSSIKQLIQSCTSLEYLTMNDCELTSLDHFPQLGRLIGLELADNTIHDKDLVHLAAVPQVNFLALSNNRIATPAAFRTLQCLPELEILELEENQICEVDGYRRDIFNLLPSVKVVDRLDRAGVPAQEENPSEYISNLGNSRLDLLEGLQQDDNNEAKEDQNRTATSYAPEGGLHRQRKNSLQQAMALHPNHFSIFHPLSPSRSFTPQKGFFFMRAESATNSDSEEEEGLIKSFKKKLHKRD